MKERVPSKEEKTKQLHMSFRYPITSMTAIQRNGNSTSEISKSVIILLLQQL